MSPKTSRKTIVIKKYGNRRLYDTANSEYINQDEVAQMVQDGKEIQVVDAATGEDITRLVLTQIIVQHAKEPDSTFPLDILRQMVAACGKATQGTTVQYMKAVLDMYQNAFRAVAPPPLSPFNFVPPPFAAASGPVTLAADVTQESPRSQRGSDERSGEQEVKELKRRLAELEELVTKRKSGKRQKRKGTSRRKG
jgi:polyhydroxyalkanoate synthesis repressor PhaR